MPEHHRPIRRPTAAFDNLVGSTDSAEAMRVAHATASALLMRAREDESGESTERLIAFTAEHGIDDIAELWAQAPAVSLPGALWRLYLLRDWVQRQPVVAAREFAAGKMHAPVREVLAGVVDPPSPADVLTLVDAVVRGILGDDFDVALDRAAAFAHIVGVGRAQLDEGDPGSAARLVDMAAQLHRAAAIERSDGLT